MNIVSKWFRRAIQHRRHVRRRRQHALIVGAVTVGSAFGAFFAIAAQPAHASSAIHSLVPERAPDELQLTIEVESVEHVETR